jgi:hypothetical protein
MTRNISTLNLAGRMQQPQLVSFWGAEGNPHANPATCNNGGGYYQPYGGALWFVPGIGDVVVEYDDNSCGDFGSRWDAQITICATGRQWLFGVDQMQDDADGDRWNVAASHGVYRAVRGISGWQLIHATREAVKTAAYRMQPATV